MQHPDSGHGGIADIVAEFEGHAGPDLQGHGDQRRQVYGQRLRRGVGGKRVGNILLDIPRLYPENLPFQYSPIG